MAPSNNKLYQLPSYDNSSVPLPTTRPPPRQTPTNRPGAGTLRRGKTLVRPERSVAPAPLIKPPPPVNPRLSQAPSGLPAPPSASSGWGTWTFFSHLTTFWAPPFLLSSIGGMKDGATRQAWREKIALCFIALILGAVVGFATMGLDRVLCPQSDTTDTSRYSELGGTPGTLGVQGFQFNISQTGQAEFYTLSAQEPGQDITNLFVRAATDYPACKGNTFKAATDDPCPNNSCPFPAATQATFSNLKIVNTSFVVGYDWVQVSNYSYFLVIDGAVLNLTPYMEAHKSPVANDEIDLAIRTIINQPSSSGKDATRLFYNRESLKAAVPCLVQRYYAGNIDKITPGCVISQIFLYAGLVVILGLVLVRFAMACVFNWFLSSRLVAPPKNLNRKVISPAVMPEGANVAVDNRHGTAPWAAGGGKLKTKSAWARLSRAPSPTQSHLAPQKQAPGPLITMSQIGAELFAVCLVTCYSEGEDSIRTTLDSISSTTYGDSRKLLFIVADGLITGAGEKRSTPDICVGLLEADPRFGNPMPMSYLAVGAGPKKENRAMVYAGHYTVAGRRTPTVIIVKCGTDAEALSDKKPGNRGKRDSQLILMNFFSRITYNDRMTPLDFDLFRKIHILMGVTPDFFEVCLMVDADTKVYPDSLKQLVNCMHHDNLIMGVCGETRIANKRQSWVTAIQVYEYFISHHLAKAFESVFGGVTCLPGCFSMYRLKARKQSDDDWVPLIIKPEIVKEYSQSEVTTLHQKNLLLLGEDRFLTTILLRTFPNRKMMFCPQARCRTVVPDTFSVLLSQRRRWINSTIHNLMELVRVRNLCGTFCFSMQFVVFMDLLGTTVLPVAISLTYALIVNMALNPPDTFEKAIPLMLLASVIGLPAVLILITTRKVVYVFWMLIYLVALPIWNFVLPVYAYWHFDDFSWGETRRVEGEAKSKAHDDPTGVFEGNVPLRRWEDWERSRLRKLRREEKRRRDLERSFPDGYTGAGPRFLGARAGGYEASDTYSMISTTEDDIWGQEIGGYDEHGAQFPPPPQTLLSPEGNVLATATIVGKDELEAMLDEGWDDDAPPPLPSPGGRPPLLNPHAQSSPRFQLSDAPPPLRGFANPNPYTPLAREPSPATPRNYPTPDTPTIPVNPNNGMSSAVEPGGWRTHAKRRSSGSRPPGPEQQNSYGPLGPLDPGPPPLPRTGKKF